MPCRFRTLPLPLLMFVLACFAWAATAAPAAAQQCQRLRIAAMPDLPPASWAGPQGPQGMALEIATRLAEVRGLPVEIVAAPDRKALTEALDKGQVDLLAGVAKSDDLAAKVTLLHPPVAAFGQDILAAVGGFDPQTVKNLLGKRGLRVAGENLGRIDALAEKLELTESPSREAALKTLAAGEADYLITAGGPALLEARRLGLADKIRDTNKRLRSMTVGLGLAHASPCASQAMEFSRDLASIVAGQDSKALLEAAGQQYLQQK